MKEASSIHGDGIRWKENDQKQISKARTTDDKLKLSVTEVSEEKSNRNLKVCFNIKKATITALLPTWESGHLG